MIENHFLKNVLFFIVFQNLFFFRHSMSESPQDESIHPHPIHSASSPNISENQDTLNVNHPITTSRGILSRLTFEREQRNIQTSSSVENKDSNMTPVSSAQSEPNLSRIYHPENYVSSSHEQTEEPIADCLVETESDEDNDNDGNDHHPVFELENNNNPTPLPSLHSFGHEYFLNDWTLRRIKSLLHEEISIYNQLCLNIFKDGTDVQSIVDEQIHGCSPRMPSEPPKDVCIELIKLFDSVKIIFPSRAIRLYKSDYLLLAILCSNNQCAYIRTSTGWAYTDDDAEHGSSFVVDEISEMIDDPTSNVHTNSEQCLHLLKNASYLYYKLVE